MSAMSISQSAMLPDSVHAARRFSMSSSSHSPRYAFESVNSKRAMCTMHIENKAMYAAMSMAGMAASAGIMIVKTGVNTSVSLFAADLLSVAFIAFVVLLVVSLLLGSLVELISLLLTCLTGLTTLESLVGQTKSKVELASTSIENMQGD